MYKKEETKTKKRQCREGSPELQLYLYYLATFPRYNDLLQQSKIAQFSCPFCILAPPVRDDPIRIYVAETRMLG